MTDFSSDLDLDLTLLEEIADGSDEFIIESIDMFLQQTPIALQEVSEALDEKDWVGTASAAHKIKATLGFFGMLATQALTQDVELGCKAPTPDAVEIADKFSQMQALITANTTALLKIRAEAASRL